MKKHTPGPWTPITWPNGGGHYIKEIWAREQGEISDNIVRIEDARLAAAAPDLLNALQALVAMFDSKAQFDQISFARCMIAKATGRGV